ncbi:hypothetical protein POM88_024898 [Heracleum sosnowskyi]|uniref:Nuclear pore complex protein GP210 C-terminal Ig-like domain-containing protein n=1 Tax=Heracleum sosnowskyi TaxID=360622 RepID=A0AAD8MMN4_9APIA|nr:hypothetical protein POM88_024898 [Heracleum sosnowskyi]
MDRSSIEKSNNTRQAASVSVKALLRGTNNASGYGSALFIGGFGDLEMDNNSLQLKLTLNSNKSVITIFGNTDIEVQMQGQDQLLISGDNRVMAGYAEYEIRVLRCEGFKDEVIISLRSSRIAITIKISKQVPLNIRNLYEDDS